MLKILNYNLIRSLKNTKLIFQTEIERFLGSIVMIVQEAISENFNTLFALDLFKYSTHYPLKNTNIKPFRLSN